MKPSERAALQKLAEGPVIRGMLPGRINPAVASALQRKGWATITPRRIDSQDDVTITAAGREALLAAEERDQRQEAGHADA